MALVFPAGAETIALSYLVGKIASTEGLTLHLYTNDVIPGETDTVITYTEATGNGYAAIPLTGANWSISGSDPTTASYAQQTFTFTGALGNVYGYYLTRTSTADLVWAERFTDGPYNIVNNGDQIKVTCRISLD